MVDRTKEFPRYMTVNHAGEVWVFGESVVFKGYFVFERFNERGSVIDRCNEEYLFEIETETTCKCCGQTIK